MTLRTTIAASGILDQWADEILVEYDTGAEGKTVSAILDDWIALQVNSNPLTKGTIAGTIANEVRAIAVQEGSMLQNLWSLRESVGGYIYVSTDRKLNWAASIGEDKGQWFHYRLNMPGIERTIDYSKMVNKLYAYGAYAGDARIKLSDADGQAEDYVEDATSQGTYGVKVKAITNRTITHPDTLLEWATLYLADHKLPVYTYRVKVVMLSELDDASVDWYALQLGSTVTVTDDDLSISTDLTVVAINQPDLDEPWNIEVELSNVVEDVSDLLAEVYSAQQLEQHAATKIGPGQVVISGVVTVQDWVSEGETTINGAQITTGTITADQIAASTITVTECSFTPVEEGGAAADVNNNVTTISGGKITTGTITATQIEAGSITATELNFTPVEEGGAAADVNNNATTINGAKITTGTLAADRITTGTLGSATITLDGVSSILKSSNYSAGSAGWQIKGNGDAEFNDVTVRGAVYASSGEFTGTLKTTSIDSGKTLTVNGAISAGGGKVLIDSTGIHIYEDFLNFLESDINYGGIYADHTNTRLSIVGSKILLLRAYDGDLLLETLGGADEIVANSPLRPSANESKDLGADSYRWNDLHCKRVYTQIKFLDGFRPSTTNVGDMGGTDGYFNKAYADTYYGKTTTIQSFQGHDDVGLLRQMHTEHTLDTDRFPSELLEPEADMEAALEQRVAECEARRLDPEIPLAVAQEHNRRVMANAQRSLAVRGVNLLAWQSLLMGALLQIDDRLKRLEGET